MKRKLQEQSLKGLRRMPLNKPVNCYKCSKILCMVDSDKEFSFKTKCPHCGVKQVVRSEKKYVVSVRKVNGDLSTG